MTEPNENLMIETRKYLDDIKLTNRKLYNKYNKKGRKFSDIIMKKLK